MPAMIVDNRVNSEAIHEAYDRGFIVAHPERRTRVQPVVAPNHRLRVSRNNFRRGLLHLDRIELRGAETRHRRECTAVGERIAGLFHGGNGKGLREGGEPDRRAKLLIIRWGDPSRLREGGELDRRAKRLISRPGDPCPLRQERIEDAIHQRGGTEHRRSVFDELPSRDSSAHEISSSTAPDVIFKPSDFNRLLSYAPRNYSLIPGKQVIVGLVGCLEHHTNGTSHNPHSKHSHAPACL